MSRAKIFSTKRLLFLWMPLFLLFSIGLAGSWLLFSGAGAKWLWSQLEDATGNSLSAQRIEGGFIPGITIYGLEYKTAELKVITEKIGIRARPILWPFAIEVRELFLQRVAIHQPLAENVQQDSKEPLDVSAVIDALSLPMAFHVNRVKIDHLEYWQAGPDPALLMDSISFGLVMDENLSINNLVFYSKELELKGNAKLELGRPYPLTITSSGQFKSLASQTGQSPALPFELQVNGNLENLGFRLVSDKLGLDVSGNLSDPFAKPMWVVTGGIEKLPQQVQFSGGEFVFSGSRFNIEGNPENWTVVLDSTLDISTGQSAGLLVSAVGSVAGINVQQATLRGTGIELELTGLIDWSNEFQADLHAVIDQLDISPWLQDWPEDLYLKGQLDLNWSADGLKIPASHLTLSETGFAVNVNADIDLQTRLIDAHLDWTNFRWPLNKQVAVFDSRSGRMDISGSVDQWTANGELELKVGDYPAGRFNIEGEGNGESAHTRVLQGDVLGGQLSGSVELDWENELKWALDLSAEKIDPEPLFPGWPGQLDGEFQVASDGPSMPVNVQIPSLQGTLRGTPIDAGGNFGIANDYVWFEQLEVRTDQASLRLHGNSLDKAGVSVNFNGQLPSMILQGASGSLEMKAQLSGNRSAPLIKMQLQALDFAWNGLGIKAMEISTNEEPTDTVINSFDLNASELRWKDEKVDEVSVSLRGKGQLFHLQASMASELLDLNTSIEMTPEDKENLFRGRWTGLLSTLDLIIAQKLNFSLASPAPMTWTGEAFSLESTCLEETGGGGICTEFGRDANGDVALKADVTAFPVDYLRHLFALDIKFEQILDGHLEWYQTSGKGPTGGADLHISAGRVVDLIDNEPLLDSNAGVMRFALAKGNLESGKLDIEFPGIGFIDVDFEVADIIGENGQGLTGRAVSQLNDIQLIGQLAFPGADEVNGRFNSDIRLGGTLLDPQFEGGFSLTSGTFHYQPTGLKLEEVRLTGKVESRDRGSLTGQFLAGRGVGEIEGRFFFDNPEAMKLELNLSGEQLLLVNTQTIKMLSNTMLDIGVRPNRLDINGSILIPSANLTPANLVLETVSDSEDLVVETRGGETNKNETDKAESNQVFGTLEIAFGDDVKVEVPGIDTSVQGSVEYRWNGDVVPVAEGSYTLNGKVDIYGPTLTINNGSISFPNVPANNPMLNIRAQRDILGNTEIRSAGVQVIGTLKRPVLEAFTVPVTNEDRAWALLVTGSDFDQSQGVGGFDVGTYIGPKLYVSYGISLFESENVVSARYDLKKGFGIKVTSGQRETGLDISYTIDR